VAAYWLPRRVGPTDAVQPLVRLDVDLGSDVSLPPLVAPTFSSLVISPDGTRLVFVGSMSGASSRLFTRRLDDPQLTELVGTEGATQPFFSPDGQWLAFWRKGNLAKVPIEGGAVVTLTDLSPMTGGSWVDNSSLIAGTGTPGAAGLVRVPADGGTPTPILKLAPNEWFHTFPQLLPGRNAVLMSAVSAPISLETSNVDIVSLDDGRRKTIVRGATSARYLESGHLLYANRAGMFAVPFDLAMPPSTP
jgi:eukaryotic-like serine/threonine-protein kinase